MDTVGLSSEAFGIIQLAETFDENLHSMLIASCTHSPDEKEYLQNVLKIVEGIDTDANLYVGKWGLTEQFTIAEYRKQLKELKNEIKRVLKIPEERKTNIKWE